MQKLLIFSLFLSLAGIFLIIILSNTLSPKNVKVSDIDSLQVNERIQFSGKIIKVINLAPNFLLLKIIPYNKDEKQKSNKTLDATLNSNSINLNISQIYLFTGRVQEYNNSPQVNIESITLKNI